jgi:hypothetical protein
MKTLTVKFWSKHIVYASMNMNAEGRLSYNFPPDTFIDRITIEPDDPDSKVEMTHYGAKYTP